GEEEGADGRRFVSPGRWLPAAGNAATSPAGGEHLAGPSAQKLSDASGSAGGEGAAADGSGNGGHDHHPVAGGRPPVVIGTKATAESAGLASKGLREKESSRHGTSSRWRVSSPVWESLSPPRRRPLAPRERHRQLRRRRRRNAAAAVPALLPESWEARHRLRGGVVLRLLLTTRRRWQQWMRSRRRRRRPAAAALVWLPGPGEASLLRGTGCVVLLPPSRRGPLMIRVV
ncbi:unnamed protein product, partial [Ectocarpus sp. 4 AP-2014]